MSENFDTDLHDTVYVTSNPYTPNIPENTFFKVINLLDEWDDDYETVLPETVAMAAIEAHEKYPNKRLIAHFMQPHYPFIGEKGRQLSHRGLRDPQSDEIERPSVWDELQWGFNEEITEADVYEAYRENLRVALDETVELLDAIDGKSVITSDHGVLIGERLSPIPVKGYGHTSGLRVRELIEVPWLEISAETRREIQRDRPKRSTNIDEDVVNERLEAFGYKA